MEHNKTGLIIKSVGGLFELMPDADCGSERVVCRARGAFRHQKMRLLVGDRVRYDTEPDGSGAVLEILPRRNALIRPPLANLDMIFVVLAASYPEPDLVLTDKLISIAEFSGIRPILVITKDDQNADTARSIRQIYEKSGFDTFVTSSLQKSGIDRLTDFIRTECPEHISAVAGVSGAGKTSLLNVLFPSLSLQTGELSRRIERGKNTTRQAELFALNDLLPDLPADMPAGYIADTPGFSLLDFTRFDFYTKEDLPFTFREFAPYLGKCRYTKCSHTKEEGCAIRQAISDGIIPPERHKSYCAIFNDLKNKHAWDK